MAQTHSESITVEVVDVPVYVYNSNGTLQNLKKDDFELYVNGKPQSIDYFDPIDFRAPAKTESAPAPTAVVPRDVRDRRLFLLVLDCAFTRPAALDRARKAAAAMIDASTPADYFSVATFTAKNGLQLLAPFTNDHVVAKRAAMALRASSVHDPLAITISANERETARVIAIMNNDSVGKGDPDPVESGAVISQLAYGAATDNAAMPIQRLIEDQVTDYSAIAKRLAPFAGDKHVVVMSEGFSPGEAYQEARLMQDLKSMADAFRAAGAIVDTIDLGGTSRDSFENDALHLMAQETGGRFIQHQNDVKDALNRISTASAVGYRLGFNVPKDARKGDNTIDVKVRNVPRGTTVSFRHGFSTNANKPSPRDYLFLADVILNDVPQTGIAPRILFPEPPYAEVVVPVRQLLAVNNGKAMIADVMFYVFDDKHAVVEFKNKKIVIPADAKLDMVLRDPLHLTPGASYTAKALLRVGDSLGFTKQNFAIP
ncbi:MAG TPA: VWA domain-containing protein [Thermoanaerobaculia bacterium]|nr:VWA domain-containing protein [Thermoanaerobaculia bacterium]